MVVQYANLEYNILKLQKFDILEFPNLIKIKKHVFLQCKVRVVGTQPPHPYPYLGGKEGWEQRGGSRFPLDIDTDQEQNFFLI